MRISIGWRRWALRVFLCPKSQTEAMRELVDVAAEGHEFHTVDPTAPVG